MGPPPATPTAVSQELTVKTVLVAIHTEPSPQAVPLANAFLKSYLSTEEGLRETVSVTLVDFFTADETAGCVAAIRAEKPDAVGFSMYLWNREKCAEIATALHREEPRLILFTGGPEPTAQPEEVLAEAPFHFAVKGEGEIPFLMAMARLEAGEPVAGIRGIATPDVSGAAVEPGPPAILETVPSPYLTGQLDPARYPGILWQLSRGCEFGCDFCFDHRGKQGSRRFSPERLRAELTLFAQKGVSQVFVLDSTFNYNPRLAKDILKLIRKVAPHIHFHFEVRSEFIDREMAGLFSQVNCSLQIGLQSADPKVQQQVRRSFMPANFREKVSLLNEAGAIFGFDIIYGLPGDTLEGFARTIDFALALYPNHLDIFPLAVLPGTALAERAESLGLRHLHSPPYTLIESPAFGSGDMGKAASLAAACDIFYTRGKAVAWFNAVVSPLGLRPSRFLGAFSEYLAAVRPGKNNERDYGDREIWQLQRDFVSERYREKGVSPLLPAALDLVDYHYHYAAALLAVPPELPTDRELAHADLLALPFSVAKSTRLVRFHYEIFDLLEAGDVDLAEFAECFSAVGSCAAIYPRAGEVFTESLNPAYFELLQKLDGSTPAHALIRIMGLSAEEGASFLEFAAAEGIITC